MNLPVPFSRPSFLAPAIPPARQIQTRVRDLFGRGARAYQTWSEDRDFAAIYAALARLSDRRLHMIGMRRETLVDDVERLIEAAEENRNLEQEILALVEDRHHPALPGARVRAGSEEEIRSAA